MATCAEESVNEVFYSGTQCRSVWSTHSFSAREIFLTDTAPPSQIAEPLCSASDKTLCDPPLSPSSNNSLKRKLESTIENSCVSSNQIANPLCSVSDKTLCDPPLSPSSNNSLKRKLESTIKNSCVSSNQIAKPLCLVSDRTKCDPPLSPSSNNSLKRKLESTIENSCVRSGETSSISCKKIKTEKDDLRENELMDLSHIDTFQPIQVKSETISMQEWSLLGESTVNLDIGISNIPKELPPTAFEANEEVMNVECCVSGNKLWLNQIIHRDKNVVKISCSIDENTSADIEHLISNSSTKADLRHFIFQKWDSGNMEQLMEIETSYPWVVWDLSTEKIYCSNCGYYLNSPFSKGSKMISELRTHQRSRLHVLKDIICNPTGFCNVMLLLRYRIQDVLSKTHLIRIIKSYLGLDYFSESELEILLEAVREGMTNNLKPLFSEMVHSISVDLCRNFTVVRWVNNGHPQEHLLPHDAPLGRYWSENSKLLYECKKVSCGECKICKEQTHSNTSSIDALSPPTIEELILCFKDIHYIFDYINAIRMICDIYNHFPRWFCNIPNAKVMTYPSLCNYELFTLLIRNASEIREICRHIYRTTGSKSAYGILCHSLMFSNDLGHIVSFLNYLVNHSHLICSQQSECKNNIVAIFHKSYETFKCEFLKASAEVKRSEIYVDQILDSFDQYFKEIRRPYKNPIVSMKMTEFLWNPHSLSVLSENYQNLTLLRHLIYSCKIKPESSFQNFISSLSNFGRFLLSFGLNFTCMKDIMEFLMKPDISQRFPVVFHFYWTILSLPYFPAKRTLPFFTLDVTQRRLAKTFGSDIANDLLLVLMEGPLTVELIETIRICISKIINRMS